MNDLILETRNELSSAGMPLFPGSAEAGAGPVMLSLRHAASAAA